MLRFPLGLAAPAMVSVTLALVPPEAHAQGATRLPEIRMHRDNGVPACVTPERLMAFLSTRNATLDPRYRNIAKWYRQHGEAWRVRWDYAFFQMALETNFLTYRRGNGDPGDVKPGQNNFAGIGATGGGVAGDRFPDVGTGVLAQMQHLVAYSGEMVPRPVAPRTALRQSDIVSLMRRLKRPVRFSDLARRWAADPRYAQSIAFIAESYQRRFCRDSAPAAGGTRQRGAAAETTTPEQQAAARARATQVARTVWRRGEAMPAHLAIGPRDTAADPVTGHGIGASNDGTDVARVPTAHAPFAMLGGLQAIAADVNSQVPEWPAAAPIVAPAPRLAERTPRLAARD